jgi:hypothetical protein
MVSFSQTPGVLPTLKPGATHCLCWHSMTVCTAYLPDCHACQSKPSLPVRLAVSSCSQCWPPSLPCLCGDRVLWMRKRCPSKPWGSELPEKASTHITICCPCWTRQLALHLGLLGEAESRIAGPKQPRSIARPELLDTHWQQSAARRLPCCEATNAATCHAICTSLFLAKSRSSGYLPCCCAGGYRELSAGRKLLQRHRVP